ncbi:MAG: hypothetical protein KatS3mg003_1048 [Candidatus Nitrosocaldaceae archaeon]|nr:MAG: hypothetical protein KatS3mg003_1048 [Candidatus Nitrosocaldaceae archaeon]
MKDSKVIGIRLSQEEYEQLLTFLSANNYNNLKEFILDFINQSSNIRNNNGFIDPATPDQAHAHGEEPLSSPYNIMTYI